VQSLTHHVNEIAAHVHANRTEGQPCFVAIAGAPGSGKSTLATEVARRLNAQHAQTVVVAMDGFHLDNRILEPRGLLQTCANVGYQRALGRAHSRAARAIDPAVAVP